MMHFITVILEILILIVLYEMTVVHKPDNKGRLLILAVRRELTRNGFPVDRVTQAVDIIDSYLDSPDPDANEKELEKE